MDTALTATSRKLAELPDDFRVWVYKSLTAFSPEQMDTMNQRAEEFLRSWAWEDKPLTGAFQVLNRHAVAIAADLGSADACGCSIDHSIQFIKKLEEELDLLLTDRLVVLYERDGAVHACRAPELAELHAAGRVDADTVVLDDMVSTKADLDERFRIRIGDSWMARYL